MHDIAHSEKQHSNYIGEGGYRLPNLLYTASCPLLRKLQKEAHL